MAEDSFRSEEIISQPLDGSFVEISILEGDIDSNKPDHSSKVTSTPLKPARKPREKNGVYPFQCDICLKDFKYKFNLNRHVRLHTSHHSCTRCSISFEDQESLTSHKEKKHSTLFVCPVCGKIFANNRSYNNHCETHSEDKTFKCPFPTCSKQFVRKDYLRDHVHTHSGVKPYSCDTCKKAYSSKASLSHHVKYCSRGIKCKDCNQTFNSRTTLVDHQASMHGMEQFRCAICSKCFKWRTSLSRHRRVCKETN